MDKILSCEKRKIRSRANLLTAVSVDNGLVVGRLRLIESGSDLLEEGPYGAVAVFVYDNLLFRHYFVGGVFLVM